jgi:hypothetical protein
MRPRSGQVLAPSHAPKTTRRILDVSPVLQAEVCWSVQGFDTGLTFGVIHCGHRRILYDYLAGRLAIEGPTF